MGSAGGVCPFTVYEVCKIQADASAELNIRMLELEKRPMDGPSINKI